MIHLLLGALSVWIHWPRLNIVDILLNFMLLVLLIARRLFFLSISSICPRSVNIIVMQFILVLGSVVDGGRLLSTLHVLIVLLRLILEALGNLLHFAFLRV